MFYVYIRVTSLIPIFNSNLKRFRNKNEDRKNLKYAFLSLNVLNKIQNKYFTRVIQLFRSD